MAEPSTARPLPPPSRRRDKPQLSCNLCRRRKLKCDRGHPCETCQRRGLSLSCTYVQPGRSDRANPAQTGSSTAPDIPNRIEQLETLVVQLMNAVNSSNPAISTPIGLSPRSGNDNGDDPDLPPSQLSQHFGQISLETAESPHWDAVLDGIAELKDYYQDEAWSGERHVLSGTYSGSDRPEMLFGKYDYISREQILAVIPPKDVADRIVAAFCNNTSVAPVLHHPTFLKEYEQFWHNPTETPIIWLGLLFSVLGVGIIYQSHLLPSWSDTLAILKPYKDLIPICLAQGKYTRDPYTLEALLLYCHIEYAESEDSQIETSLLLSIIVSLALRKGLHRNPAKFPLLNHHLTPFQREMRNRTWAIIVHFETLVSAQTGAPVLIRPSHCDALEPLNLLDEDIWEDIPALPAPRPESFQTPIQFVVSNNKVAVVASQITDLTTAISPPSYPAILALDVALKAAYASVPLALQDRSMASTSLMDSIPTIIRRMYISLLYRKAQCILHHKYLLLARTESKYALSRTVCLDASFAILDTQWTLFVERKPGGRLFQAKVQSFVKSAFYLAATIMCLDLDFDIKVEVVARSSGAELGSEEGVLDTEERQRAVKALEGAYTVWKAKENQSAEEKKAVAALALILGRVEKLRNRRRRTRSEMSGEVVSGASDAAWPPSSASLSPERASYAIPPPTASAMPFPTVISADAMTDQMTSAGDKGDTDDAGNTGQPHAFFFPTSIHQIMDGNASTDVDYSDIFNMPIMTPPITDITDQNQNQNQNQNLDEMLEMSLFNTTGYFFDFPTYHHDDL